VSSENTRSRIALILCVALFLLQALFWLALFFLIYFVVPRARDVAVDRGLALSRMENLVVDLSDWFVSYAYLGIPLLLAELATTSYGVIWASRSVWKHLDVESRTS